MSKLTEKQYWDAQYGSESLEPLSLEGYRNHGSRCIFETMKLVDFEEKNILEIGAGGSKWLTLLAREFPTSSFSGLDYSEAGCDELRKMAIAENVNINVVCADLYSPPEGFENHFDIVITCGVVEHFDSLDEIIPALTRYLKPNGKLYTIIPNMSALVGSLVKSFDRSIYNIHNPHDLKSLTNGHKTAGISVEHANYVCSTEFGVLSACINEDTSKLKRFIYLWLTRLTRVISVIERKIGNLPATRYFSAYIYCIAVKKDKHV